MAEFDLLISGGMVVDGTRVPRYRADIGITDGTVVEMGRIPPSRARRVLDAGGMIVAPGFVDLHTHYDAQVFWDPYCSLSGWHGVTSVVIGNCGFGFAPVHPDHRERAMQSMTRVEAIPYASMKEGLPWDWVTFPEFLESLDRVPKALNVLPYAPVGPLLIWVLGLEAAKAGVKPTADQTRELKRLLHEAMDAGACGWSAQRLPPSGGASAQRDYDGTPMVSDVMHDATCLALAEVLRERNQGVIQMTLASGDWRADTAHYEALAEASGRTVLYNTVLPHDDRPEVHRAALKWLNRAKERGLRLYGQGQTTDAGYTFTFEDWNLFDDSEAWCEATVGTVEERLAKLADPNRRARLKAELPQAATASIDTIVVLAPKSDTTRRYENLTIGEIAAKEGKHFVDQMLDIAVADGLRTVFYANPPNTSLEHLRELAGDDMIIFGTSDGGAHTKFLTSGRYPTETLIKVVRDHGMIDLERAHWRLSALPAWCAGFRDRGVLREGAPADIVVYDLENLSILPTEVVHDLPGGEWRRIQRARGYRFVLVNGEVVLEDDKETGAAPGVLLRHGAANGAGRTA